MQHCKDPSIVGQYDKLLAYADHKAESFFLAHGFSDDPLLTAVLRCTQANLITMMSISSFSFRKKADYWENSTLMVYIPPFSGKRKPLIHHTDTHTNYKTCLLVRNLFSFTKSSLSCNQQLSGLSDCPLSVHCCFLLRICCSVKEHTLMEKSYVSSMCYMLSIM